MRYDYSGFLESMGKVELFKKEKSHYIPGLPQFGTIYRGTLIDIADKFTNYEEPAPKSNIINGKDVPDLFKRLGIKVTMPSKKVMGELDKALAKCKKDLEKKSRELYNLTEDLFLRGRFTCGKAEPYNGWKTELINNMPNWRFLIDPPGKYSETRNFVYFYDTLDVMLTSKDGNLNGCLKLINEPMEKTIHESLSITQKGDSRHLYEVRSHLGVSKINVLNGKTKYRNSCTDRKDALRILRSELNLN